MMVSVRKATSKVLDAVSADVDAGRYAWPRVLLGLGSLVSLVVWLHGLSGSALGPVVINSLVPNSPGWWVAWVVGIVASVRLVVSPPRWFDPLLVFLSLQFCGGFMVNWAHLALQNVALLLCFASSLRPPAWPLLLLKLQLASGYVLAVVFKLVQGEQWRSFSAFESMIQHPVNRYAFPVLPASLAPVLDVVGLAIELFAGLFLLAALFSGSVFVRRAGLVLSACFHVGISLLLPVGVFIFAVAPFWSTFANFPHPTWRLRLSLLLIPVLTLGFVVAVGSYPLHIIA